MDAHRTYLANLASEAFSDGTITGTERRDLESVCDMLDLNRAALDEVLAGSLRHIPQHTENFSGMTVCFTGELLASINGNRVTRTMAESIATSAGLIVQPNVTRTLDILIVADPNTQSGKAKKARGYEVRILAEASFWRAIHAPVD